MRLFWALRPPDEVVDALRPAVDRLARDHPDLRWTAPSTWHLTLAFLGDVDADLVADLVASVEGAVAPHPPVDVQLPGRAGTPTRRRAGVVWIPSVPDDRLAALAEAVRSASATVTPVDTTHPWRGHLTLARTRRRTADPGALTGAVAEAYDGPAVRWTADRIALLRSTTHPTGAVYDLVAEVSLGWRASA